MLLYTMKVLMVSLLAEMNVLEAMIYSKNDQFIIIASLPIRLSEYERYRCLLKGTRIFLGTPN